HDALLLASRLLRDEARERGTDDTVAERGQRARDHEHHERCRDAQAEVPDHQRDKSGRDERVLAEPLHQPSDQTALQDDPEEADVAEDVPNLARTERTPLIGEAALREQREARDEERKRRDEEEELQEPLAQTGPPEVLRVGLPVQRLLAVVERVVRFPPALE